MSVAAPHGSAAPVFQSVRLRVAEPVPAGDAVAQPRNRTIENLVLAIFWMLLFEGALRKWVAPQYAQYLFFIRDPFVLLVYWHALRTSAFRDGGALLQIGMAFAAVGVLLAFLQGITFGDSRLLIVLGYGWRQYFLYLPLPFVIAATFTRESLLRFARHTFVAVMLAAPLVFVQFSVAPSAVINRGVAEEASLQFQSFAYTGGRIRPSGPFTSAVGMKELIASTFALLLALWLTPPVRRNMRFALLLTATAAGATCLALSGSRGAFMHLIIVVLTALLLGLVVRDATVRGRALLLPLALVTAGAVLYPIVFPDALGAMVNRVTEAYASESRFSSLGIVGRALYETIDFFSYLGRTPLAGFGLGLGGNGRTFLAASNPEFIASIFSESDWSRHIVDLGPVVGVLFIVYRIAFTVSVFASSLRATRISGDPLPLMLFGYVGIGLFYGQLTGHGTVGGFVWLYLGLCMASCRLALRQP